MLRKVSEICKVLGWPSCMQTLSHGARAVIDDDAEPEIRAVVGQRDMTRSRFGEFGRQPRSINAPPSKSPPSTSRCKDTTFRRKLPFKPVHSSRRLQGTLRRRRREKEHNCELFGVGQLVRGAGIYKIIRPRSSPHFYIAVRHIVRDDPSFLLGDNLQTYSHEAILAVPGAVIL